MKGFFKLRPQRALNRSEAWACLTANIAMPGSGSLAAGKTIGYWQIAAAFLALVLSVVASVPMLQWAVSGGFSAMMSPTADPIQNLSTLWQHIKWPVAGMLLYFGSILWSVITSLAVLASAPKEAVPPRIV